MMEALSEKFGQDEFVKLGMASSTMQWTIEHVEEAPLGWKVPTYMDFLDALTVYEDAYYCYALDDTLGDIAKRVRYYMDLHAAEFEARWLRVAKRMGNRRRDLFLRVVCRRLARAVRYIKSKTPE